MSLFDLGFRKGGIAECIVTTYNEDGSPNAAPMGVYALSEKEVIMKIHVESDTCSNLLRNKCCVINLIFDPYLFLKTALIGRAKGCKEPEVGKNEIKKANVNAPFLKDAHAFIEAKLKEHRKYVKKDEYKKSKFCAARCEVSRVVVNRRYPVAVNRGLFAAVELAIALSRERKEDLRRCTRIMRKSLSPEEYRKIKKLLVALRI
ncbi:MAG: DUF447 domain-containing protein [Methanobacteriota archaeon]